jgi:hypothetical protein
MLEPVLEKLSTIASGATPSGALVAHPMKNYFEKSEEEKFKYIVSVKHQKINSTFRSHLERFATS